MTDPILGRDYGISVNMPLWCRLMSYIPIVNLFLTRKVRVEIIAFTDRQEPYISIFRNMRIPRMWVCPLRFNFAFPETVSANMTLYIRNNKDDNIIYCRPLKEEFKGKKELREGSWVKGVEIEKIDATASK